MAAKKDLPSRISMLSERILGIFGPSTHPKKGGQPITFGLRSKNDQTDVFSMNSADNTKATTGDGS